MLILGIAISTIGLLWTVYGIWSTNRIKKLIFNEKKMISEKILDFKSTLNGYKQIILNQRERDNNPALDQVIINIENINSMIDSLDRFANQLKEIK